MGFFKPNTDAGYSSQKSSSQCCFTRKRPDLRKPLAENTLLDGYLVKKLIGRGSFSLVYSAVEISTGLNVVIKEYFPKQFAKREHGNQVSPFDGKKLVAFHEGFKQFFNEAMALKKIRHPNLLNTYQFFNANRTAYLVSLNQDGRDLRWFLTSFREPLDQALIYKVFLPVLSALNFLHHANLLHLDIKPANILLQPNGESLLLDLGAAQKITTSQQIHRKQIVTHGYAPPEQYDKGGALGPWTDIYAVGASLYCSIVCRSPEKAKNSALASELDIEQHSKNYHPTLLKAINRSLMRDGAERYQTVDQFSAALLVESEWATLVEYEAAVLGYDRFATSTKDAQAALLRDAA